MVTPPRSTSLQRGVPAPFTAVRLDTWVLRGLEAALDGAVGASNGASAGSCVVLRADGGLWVAVGDNFYWSVFDVPAGAWRMASAISGVVLRVQDPVRKTG